MFRNAKNVGYYMIGQGCLTELGGLIDARRALHDGPAVFFLDHFFEKTNLHDRLPIQSGDQLLYVDTT
ncbi:MAG: alcohol dehydrogenase, partial [Desulfovibrionaceae bacterium]